MVSIEPRETQFSRYGANLPKNKNSISSEITRYGCHSDMQWNSL